MLITLDNLRQTLQAVKNKLDSITSRVSTVESSVNTMSSNMVNSVNGQTGAVTGIATATEVDALESRIDNIVAPSGDPSLTEVSDARVGADSTVYSTLKGRIDGEVSELNERLDSDAVRFDIAQDKTDEEKAQARANIGVEDSEVYAENVVAEYDIVTEPPKTYSEITETITPATTVNGKAWNADTGVGDTMTDYAYSRFNGISQYSKIYIDGRAAGDSIHHACVFYDSNGTKVGIVRGQNAWGVVNILVEVPTNASYAIVNGSIAASRNIPPAVRGVIDDGRIGTMVDLQGTLAEGAWKTDGTIVSGSQYFHGRYTIMPDSEYIYITGASWGSNYPLVAFYNSSSSIIRSDYPNGATRYDEVEISIPEGTSYFVVNFAHGSDLPEQVVKYPTSETGKIPTKMQSEVNAELMPLVSKKYLFVGDSYAEGYSHDGRNPGWCSYVVNYLGLSMDEYKIVYTGGYGFANGGFSSLLDTVTETGFTDVVVCGGYNDNTSTEQNIVNGITTFKNKVLGKWAGAKTHVGFVAYNKEGNGEGAISNWAEKRANLVGTVLPAYQKCVTVGCEYLNNVEYALGEAGLTPSDGYHPSAEGNQAIARAISNALLTGAAALPYNERMDNLNPGLSDDAKQALLTCFEHVAWIDGDGQVYYNALRQTLYPDEYPKITAVYIPGTHVVWDTDSLDSLKDYLTVTYYETAESAGQVLSSSQYALLGTLVVGENTITVKYGNLTTSFEVVVATHFLYKLDSPKTFTGVTSEVVDTGVPLFATDRNYSLVVKGVTNFVANDGVMCVYGQKMHQLRTYLASNNGVFTYTLDFGSGAKQKFYTRDTGWQGKTYTDEFLLVIAHTAGSNAVTARLFVNGTEALEGPYNGSYVYTQSEKNFVFGGRYNAAETSYAELYRGTINTFEIYDYALSSSEINEIISEA